MVLCLMEVIKISYGARRSISSLWSDPGTVARVVKPGMVVDVDEKSGVVLEGWRCVVCGLWIGG